MVSLKDNSNEVKRNKLIKKLNEEIILDVNKYIEELWRKY